MVFPITLNKNLTQVLIKHSDAAIAAHFMQYMNPRYSNQFSGIYKTDYNSRLQLVKSIINRHIKYKDALIDPYTNLSDIKNHSAYFWDPNNPENGQLRGPQSHLSYQMSTDFELAGSNTGMSGVDFSNLVNVKGKSVLDIPVSMSGCSVHSFRQGSEIVGAKMLSSISSNLVVLTDDNPKAIHGLNYDILHRNMPSTQRVSDFIRLDELIDSNNTMRIHAIQEDAKNMSIENSLNPKYIHEPKIVFAGTIDPKVECCTMQQLAVQAMSGNITVGHISNDPVQKTAALKKVLASGNVEDAIGLLNFTIIISNRHIE